MLLRLPVKPFLFNGLNWPSLNWQATPVPRISAHANCDYVELPWPRPCATC
jgi:hypothetical protein